MRIKQYILNLAIILVILAIVLISVMNRLISSYPSDSNILGKQHKNVAAPPPEAVNTFAQEPKDSALRPEDPEQYNIQVITDEDLRSRVAQGNSVIWDGYVKNALLHSRKSEHLEKKKKTPKELKEQLTRINRQIKDMERKSRKSSKDQTEEMKLRSLYILKSSLTVLEATAEEKFPRKK